MTLGIAIKLSTFASVFAALIALGSAVTPTLVGAIGLASFGFTMLLCAIFGKWE